MDDDIFNDDDADAPETKRARWRGRFIAGLILLGVGLAVFWPFVFGDGILLYRDIGRDSLSSYYPDFVHLSNYIRSDGFPSWSFHIGMGQDLAYATGFLFWEPVTWLPARLIAGALVYQHLFKILIAGLMFFRFLQLRRAPLPVALLGSMLVAFSAYMTAGSCWYLPAEELLAFTAILLGAETALQRGRWLLLVLSVALVGMINPFYLYLCALFLTCYVPLRLIARKGWRPGPHLKRSLIIAAIAFLGVGLGAVVTLPFLNVVLSSPRGSGATNSISTLASLPIFGFESASHYVTALLRAFSNDLAGTGDAFRGWQNYLEAPLTYCGLISLLLLPQAFLGGTRRHRVILVLFLLWLAIPTVFPWFRHLFWLFRGDYYRTYSLFCVLGLVTISLVALRRYFERGPFSLTLLFIWAAALIGVLFLPVDGLRAAINPGLRIAVIVYLALYCAILAAGRWANKPAIAVYCLLAVTAVELAHFNRISVSDRTFVRKTELTDGLAAKAGVVAALRELQREDKSFYRITSLSSGQGTAFEIEPNEPMLLGYYGTSSYSSFNDLYYIRFLAALDALPSNRETDTRWTAGLAGNFLPMAFAGEQFALVDDPEPFLQRWQYDLVRTYGRSHLFRNYSALPFGLTFTRYLPETEFLQLSRDAKEQLLLEAAVLDDATAAGLEGIAKAKAADLQADFAASSFPALIQQRRASALHITAFRQSSIEGDVRLDNNGLLVLQTTFSPGWTATQDGQATPVVRADAGLLAVPLKAGEHKVGLRYRNPWLPPGAVVTGVALLLLAVTWWRKPRLAQLLA